MRLLGIIGMLLVLVAGMACGTDVRDSVEIGEHMAKSQEIAAKAEEMTRPEARYTGWAGDGPSAVRSIQKREAGMHVLDGEVLSVQTVRAPNAEYLYESTTKYQFNRFRKSSDSDLGAMTTAAGVPQPGGGGPESWGGPLGSGILEQAFLLWRAQGGDIDAEGMPYTIRIREYEKDQDGNYNLQKTHRFILSWTVLRTAFHDISRYWMQPLSLSYSLEIGDRQVVVYDKGYSVIVYANEGTYSSNTYYDLSVGLEADHFEYAFAVRIQTPSGPIELNHVPYISPSRGSGVLEERLDLAGRFVYVWAPTGNPIEKAYIIGDRYVAGGTD